VLEGVSVRSSGAFFHEFVLQLENDADGYAEKILDSMAQQGVLAGLDLSPYYAEFKNCILICVTEVKNASDLDLFRDALVRSLKEEGDI